MAKKKAATPKPSASKASQSPKRRKPITRDVGTQSKGPRLQKLRAALMLIKESYGYPLVNSLAAVELHGDVSVTSANASETTHYVEENKSYKPNVSFSMNSHEVLNTLVAFADLWIDKGYSKNLRFGFYTPNSYSAENATSHTKEHGISWPAEAMLGYLSTARLTEPKVLEAAKLAIIAEYGLQTKGLAIAPPTSGALSHFEAITSWTDEQWKDFLSRIEWKFGESDSESIIPELDTAIQKHPNYDQQLSGKEGQIIALLVDRLDQRQAFTDPTQRILTASEVWLVFSEVKSGAIRLPDPTWRMWQALPPPLDTRNLAEKVRAVCATFPASKTARWSRWAAQSMCEQRELPDDKLVLALKYQIYDACEKKLSEILDQRQLIDEDRLEGILKMLIETTTARVADRQKQHHYTFTSSSSIENIVYELIDSCFLSFDGA